MDDEEEERPRNLGGRPSKYKPEYAEQAEKLCRIGATDSDLADFFNVNITTIWNWRASQPGFLHTIQNVEKEYANKRVERSLYQRAVGYSFDAVKIFNGPAGLVYAPYREHMPPDVAAAFIWLKNRCRDEWKDRHGDSGNENASNERVIRVIGGFPEAFENKE